MRTSSNLLYKITATASVRIEIVEATLRAYARLPHKTHNIPLMECLKYAVSRNIGFANNVTELGKSVGLPLLSIFDRGALQLTMSRLVDLHISTINAHAFDLTFPGILQDFWYPLRVLICDLPLNTKCWIIKAITNTLPLKGASTAFWEDRECPACGDGVETVEHIVFVCPVYDNLRCQMDLAFTDSDRSLLALFGLVKSIMGIRRNYV